MNGVNAQKQLKTAVKYASFQNNVYENGDMVATQDN